MKFTFVLKNGAVLHGDHADVYNDIVYLTEIHKLDNNSELEDAIYDVHLIYPESIAYSSCIDLTWDEYCDYIETRDQIEEKENNNDTISNCETCTECDCDECDESTDVNYNFKNDAGDMYN